MKYFKATWNNHFTEDEYKSLIQLGVETFDGSDVEINNFTSFLKSLCNDGIFKIYRKNHTDLYFTENIQNEYKQHKCSTEMNYWYPGNVNFPYDFGLDNTSDEEASWIDENIKVTEISQTEFNKAKNEYMELLQTEINMLINEPDKEFREHVIIEDILAMKNRV